MHRLRIEFGGEADDLLAADAARSTIKDLAGAEVFPMKVRHGGPAVCGAVPLNVAHVGVNRDAPVVAGLVPRTRSSHSQAASPIAKLQVQSGTRVIKLLEPISKSPEEDNEASELYE